MENELPSAEEPIIPTTPEEELERRRLVSLFLPYRYIKLINGEDVVAQLVLSVDIPETYMLRYPFRVLFFDDFGPGHTKFALVPLVPFTMQEVVPITRASVISMTSIRDEIKVIYTERVLEHMEEQLSGPGESTFEPDDAEPEPDDRGDEDGEPVKPKKRKGKWVN